MKCLLILPLLFLSVASQTEDACGGECGNGAKCESGPGPDSASTFEELNDEGDHHCQCLLGWTGKFCTVRVQGCGEVGGVEQFCFHGGMCVFPEGGSVAQTICNCTSATDENQSTYGGKSCEHKLSDADTCDSGDYCLNEGTCGLDFQMQPKCVCKEGFVGSRCQYEADKVPDCVLKCQNGGTCELGFRNPSSAESVLSMQHNDVNSNVQHCLCPEGFHGVLCQVGSETCGTQATVAGGAFEQAPNSAETEHHCFHGSNCIETENPDGSLQHNCDCTGANNDTHSFAGLACQFHQTSYCGKGNTLDGNDFCVNGGQCKNFQDGGVFEGCNCPDEWKGLHCELPASLDTTAYDECKLKCLNGGACRKGAKDHGIMTHYSHEIVNVLGKTGPDQEPSVDGHGLEHCECTANFTGVFCGVAAETCGDGETFCLHGSHCKEDSKTGWECDCEAGDKLVAGRFCHKEADDICHIDDASANSGTPFCVNGGTCFVDDAGLNQCNCTVGFAGRHCEWDERDDDTVDDDDDDDDYPLDDDMDDDDDDDDEFEDEFASLSNKSDKQSKIIISLSALFAGSIFVIIGIVCCTHCRGQEKLSKGDDFATSDVIMPMVPPEESFLPSPPHGDLGTPGPLLPDIDTALNEAERAALSGTDLSEGTPMDDSEAELL